MTAILLLKYWKECILIVVCCFLLYLNIVQKGQTEYYKKSYKESVELHETYVRNQKLAYDSFVIENNKTTIKYNNAVIKAEENAREKTIIANDDARAVVDIRYSLYDQISDSNSKLPYATTATVLNYTNTYSDVFKECTLELGEMAEKADKHTIDLNRLIEAWPVNEPVSN